MVKLEMREVGKKELIIFSTKKLILEKGYENISVEDITNDAGIAKGSFYTYFKSKNLVIDYILEDLTLKLKREFSIDKRMSLSNSIKKIVKERIILDEEKIKDNLVAINLSRNSSLLDKKTLNLLKEVESLLIKEIEDIITFYYKNINIGVDNIKFYSKMISKIITNYKIFTLFFSEEENDFIKDVEEVKKKYLTKDIEENIEMITESILKILTY